MSWVWASSLDYEGTLMFFSLFFFKLFSKKKTLFWPCRLDYWNCPYHAGAVAYSLHFFFLVICCGSLIINSNTQVLLKSGTNTLLSIFHLLHLGPALRRIYLITEGWPVNLLYRSVSVYTICIYNIYIYILHMYVIFNEDFSLHKEWFENISQI